MPRLLLLRAWLDTGSLPGGRGYYSPLEEGCPVLIPIPEHGVAAGEPPEWIDPKRWRSGCSGRPLADYMPLDHEWLLHNDPRLDLGFYTDYYSPWGRIPRSPEKELRPGDIVAFAAGLAEYPRGFWARRRRLAEILRVFAEARSRGRTGVYLVGYIRVQRVVDVDKLGWENVLHRYPVLGFSPHLLRPGDRPVAVLGEPHVPEEPLPLARSVAGRLCGTATETLIRLLGARAARGFLRQKCRRARVVNVSTARLMELLG